MTGPRVPQEVQRNRTGPARDPTRRTQRPHPFGMAATGRRRRMQLVPANHGLQSDAHRPLSLIRFGLDLVHPLIDRRDLIHPPPSLDVLQVHDLVLGPVEVISDKGYLLVQRFQGVAANPPARFNSTANTFSHFGQTASMFAFPLRLTRL